MSLFAAYAEEAKKTDNKEKPEWLENSSFKTELVIQQNCENDSNTDPQIEPHKRKKKVKKSKRSKKSKLASEEKEKLPENPEEELFELNRKPIREYLSVNTISRPAVAKYRTRYYLVESGKLRRKARFRRYFRSKATEPKTNDDEEPKEEKITKQNLDSFKIAKRDENFTGFTQEEEMSKLTASYNKTLTENPTDIETWLKYVEFQDRVYQFEKYYRKGSIAKAQRVLAERKISILDKAISFNPTNELLLRKRLSVAVSAFPADELQLQLRKLVDKEKDNIILWQGFIEATQCSMSHCNSPAVLALYIECLSTLHQLRRTTLSEKYIFEESILRMLYQCGLFLKQAGLFEQLWTVLKMYLELNLSSGDKDKFNIEKYFNEKELLELEEVVLGSQLPHHELWLRVEKLRESCHWLPFTGIEDCEDPQRVVFNEDVAELIHPITTNENIFKLVASILTLLKVPLIPCRHCTMQDLGLDYVPWSLDSVEALLPVFMSQYSIDTSNVNLLKDTNRLTVGPQYLKVLPGQDEYLDLILSLMENCADCLKNQDQISLFVWWFRFQRLLIDLDKQNRFKLTPSLKKKIKSKIKDLLKKEEYRNNEIFYVEYALIERSLGNSEQCIRILKTALTMNKNSVIKTKNWGEAQTNQCHLYRTLLECTMDFETNNVKLAAQSILVKLVLQRDFETLLNGLVMEAETKFKLITNELLALESDRVEVDSHFLPNFFTDWIICHGWFIFWTKGPIECGTFLENILQELEEKQTALEFQKEVIYEFYCAILFKYCTNNPGCGVFKILDDTLFRAIEKYPNNLYLLAILAKVQSLTRNVGISAWKVQDLLLKSGRSIGTIFSLIIHDLVRTEIEKDVVDSITGKTIDISHSFKNKMLSLYKKVTGPNMCTRRCGLAWRLYLQFVYTYFDSKLCRDVYYRAVEECPWLKALYIDAAIYIPAELPQIQDLIIEKQLRLHVTPEELDILRS